MRTETGDGNTWFPRDLLDVVRTLHDTPHRFAFNFAGVGAWTLALLHAVPGSSRTILEATDAYHPQALTELIERSGLEAPTQAVSTGVAEALAARTLERADALTQSDEPRTPTFGVGLTGTVATDRTKRGDHRFHLAVRDHLGTERFSITLEKGARDRMGEEEHVAHWLLYAIGRASGLMGHEPPKQREAEALDHTFHPTPAFHAFLDGDVDVLHLNRNGEVDPSPPHYAGIVSGSFHPMHYGHRELADAAEAHLGGPVAFEMAPTNAEKEPTSPLGIRSRATQAYGVRPLLLTRAPLFSDKARRLPGTVFVVGVDTARRVLEPRFYGGEQERNEAFERLRQQGSRFLVAGRSGGDAFRTLEDLDVPTQANDLFEALPTFRADVSSTELRTKWNSPSNTNDTTPNS